MMVTRYKYFKWTPRTAWINIAYVFLVPATLGYFAYTTDVSRADDLKANFEEWSD